MKLGSVIDFWDDYIKDWVDGPKKLADSEKAKGRYFAHSKKLNTGVYYLPEPYYGNIEKPSVVIIDFNPGLSSPFDRFKEHVGGRFLYDYVGTHPYSQFNEVYSPFTDASLKSIGTSNEIPGAEWWRDKRMDWIKNFVANYSSLAISGDPLVFELCPWHSKEWSSKCISGMQKFLLDYVFEPASDAIGRSDLPFGFCFGKGIGDELVTNQNFSVIFDWNKDNIIGNWPKSTGKNSDRSYRLLKGTVNGSVTYFLNVFATGTYTSPARPFRTDVEPLIMEKLKDYFQSI